MAKLAFILIAGRCSNIINLSELNLDTIDDAKIKHHIDLMNEKYIAHWKQNLQHSKKKMKFYKVFKNNYKPSMYLDFTENKF